MKKQIRRRVAVLGAGIMGSCLALSLARRGDNVTLFDRESRAVDRSSRWNEGKIHLGYLYGADRSLATARHILPGSLQFGPILSDLTGSDIRSLATTRDDLYFVHKDSVTAPDELASTFFGVSGLLRDHPNSRKYLVDVSRAKAHRLSGNQLEQICDTSRIVAGFSVPERSVDTQRVADALGQALAASPLIDLRFGTEVTSVAPERGNEGRWSVETTDFQGESYDIVVNALWNGRLKIDVTAGIRPDYEWSNRYRLALFIQTARDVDVNCGIITVGPFGDVKSYSPRSFYLSWYPTGLIHQSVEIDPGDPRPISSAQKDAVVAAVQRELGGLLSMVGPIFDAAETIVCDGGFVFARGSGSIGDPASTLHRRDLFGVERLGNYFSVDTGKYSTAPWMADQLADVICKI